MAYIRLEPKSFLTIKYSQSFEVVLFHIIHVKIKYHKGSHYPHFSFFLSYVLSFFILVFQFGVELVFEYGSQICTQFWFLLRTHVTLKWAQSFEMFSRR